MATTSSQYSCSSISGSGKRERPPTSFPTPMPPAPSSLMMQYDMQFPSQLKLKRSQHPAPHQVPSSVSFAKGPSSKHQQSNIMHQLEIPDPAPVIGQKNHINTVSLQDDDIFLMLREPLVDFDPHASNANIVQL